MSTDEFVLFLLLVVILTLTPIAYFRNRRRPKTSHDNDEKIFRTAPRWAGRLNEKLDQVLAGQRRDKERDRNIMALEDDILAQLEASNTKQDGFLVILKALQDNQNNPAKLQAIAKAIGEQQSDWEAAFNTTTQPEPPFNPSGN